MQRKTPAENPRAIPSTVWCSLKNRSIPNRNTNAPRGHIREKRTVTVSIIRRDHPPADMTVAIDIASSGLWRAMARKAGSPHRPAVPWAASTATLAARAIPSISVWMLNPIANPNQLKWLPPRNVSAGATDTPGRPG